VNILKNKHVVIAMIVAPILGVISWLVTSDMIGEKPHVAEEGQSYQLVEMPNCRYDSGICGLKNGDFELKLNTAQLDDGRVLLTIVSIFPLDGVRVALAENGTDEKRPVEMQAMGDEGLEWSLEMSSPDPEVDRLHLVASSNLSLYYGDAALKFMLKL
jgi:hypothetical protein